MKTATDPTKTETAAQVELELAYVPADGDDSPVRRAGQRTLHASADAGPGAPLHWRRSGRGRRLRSAADDDYITSTHRGHGHCLAKGAALDRMFAELLGKEAGYCNGKGGSMHIADPETGNLGANAIVGGSAGIATGAALSAKRLERTRSPSASSAKARWGRACCMK